MQIRQQQIFRTMNVEYINWQLGSSNGGLNQILLVMQQLITQRIASLFQNGPILSTFFVHSSASDKLIFLITKSISIHIYIIFHNTVQFDNNRINLTVSIQIYKANRHEKWMPVEFNSWIFSRQCKSISIVLHPNTN